MPRNGWFSVLLAAVLVTNLVLLGVLVLQLDSREERSIQQTAQLRELAEATDRVRGEIQRLNRAVGSGDLALGPATDAAASSGRTWLHPEVENALEPHDFVFTSRDAESDGTLTRWFGSEPRGFNVMTMNAADLSDLYGYIGTGVANRMAWSDPDRWFGDAAERVEITNDEKEFTIYLKRGIKWQKPGVDLSDPNYAWMNEDRYLTARDVAFSLEILKHPQVENGPIKSYYQDLESWEVIDDHTIVVRWGKPYYGAIEATLGIGIMPEWFYAHAEDGSRFPEETLGVNFNNHWFNSRGIVGAGPYRFAEYQRGEFIRLERYEDYLGEAPAIREIVWRIFADRNLRFLKLRSHELDVAGLTPSQYREAIKEKSEGPFHDGSISHERLLGMNYFFLGWNMRKPLFQDHRVRRALTHAIDRQEIIDSVFEGLGRVPPGHFYALSPYNDPDVQPLAFDQESSRALFAEAGWADHDGDGILDKDGTNFEFTLLIYSSSAEIAAMANIIKESLLKLGIRMKIEAAEWSLMQKRMEAREFDAFTGGWGLSWDPDPYQIWHSSQADVPRGSNAVGFRNEEADQLILELRQTFDKQERLRKLHRFHRILHEAQPYTLIYVREDVFCWWNNVQRMTFSKVRPHFRSLPWWISRRG